MNLAQLAQTGFDYLALGGYVMPPLALAAAALWFALGYRASLLRHRRPLSPQALLRRAAEGTLGPPQNLVERAALHGVELARAHPDSSLPRRLEVAFGPLIAQLDRYRVLTRAVIAIAPLLGLLGTVSGMIETFASLGDMALFTQSGGIAGGISQALLTTQLGLAIAIPGLIVGGMLEQRQRALRSHIDELAAILAGPAPLPTR